ncbi:MAG: OmpA family protein [Azospirillaceae bacterium]|nr:OmpA family protein [Azospirillaceae bacterium]
MEKFFRVGLIVLSSFAAVPAFAADTKVCNPVIDARTNPVVTAAGKSVIHAGSYDCPVTAAAPAAPAAAPTPPAAQTARNYLVFFDFDKSTLTDQARRIIADAAENAKRGGVSRIQLTGHTDTVGTQQYNLRLSVRRADAVKAEFVHLGVPSSNISATGVGKLHPLVATGDGVREPSNRRVEIVFP